MSDKATLEYQGKKIELDAVIGSENEIGLDITQLRAKTGMITLDPGYGNTGSCTSDITFINGEKGILRHRGYRERECGEQGESGAQHHFGSLVVVFVAASGPPCSSAPLP